MRLTDRYLASMLENKPTILELIRQQRMALKECVEENLKLREYERLYKEERETSRLQQVAISKLEKRIETFTQNLSWLKSRGIFGSVYTFVRCDSLAILLMTDRRKVMGFFGSRFGAKFT